MTFHLNTNGLNGGLGRNPECVQIFRRLPGESCRDSVFLSGKVVFREATGASYLNMTLFCSWEKATHALDGSENPIPNHLGWC